MINIYVLHSEGTWTYISCRDEEEARRVFNEEVKWESAAFVLCPALKLEQFGDFVGVSHSHYLKGTL